MEVAMAGARPTRALDTDIFGEVFNSCPIGIAVEGFDGQPLYVNPALCSMLGFTEEELRSKHCQEALHNVVKQRSQTCGSATRGAVK